MHGRKPLARNVPAAVFVRRVAVLQQLLTKGYDVIVSDADVVWLKSPFASLASGESNFQLTADSDVADDGTQKPCTGVMLVKASEPSRQGTSWLAAYPYSGVLHPCCRCQLYCACETEHFMLHPQLLLTRMNAFLDILYGGGSDSLRRTAGRW